MKNALNILVGLMMMATWLGSHLALGYMLVGIGAPWFLWVPAAIWIVYAAVNLIRILAEWDRMQTRLHGGI